MKSVVFSRDVPSVEGDDARSGHALLGAHLPRTLIEHWARDPDGPSIWHEVLEGTLMHCDMSGFTAMSERLARRGREGAELMAGVLNRFFERMLGIAAGWGGLQVKFGGDAMLLLFDGAEHAARAATCALDMQRAMKEFRNVEAGGDVHRLRMRAGMHSGTFVGASVGDETGPLHYLLLGADVQCATAVEAAGALGRLAASDAARNATGNVATFVCWGDAWLLKSIGEVKRPPQRMDVSGAPADKLRRYLMRPFAALLAEGREPQFVPEHRRVTAVFIHVTGIAEMISRGETVRALHETNSYVRVALEKLERHGGHLGGSDASEHGDKLICLFGAPVSSERDEEGALRFALDVDGALAEAAPSLAHSVGISTGYVFAGEIGSTQRREYTVIGDSVNLAARLMAAAPQGQVYVSGPTVERCREQFILDRLRPMSVKGKTARVQAYRLRGAVATERAPARHATLRAREEELAQINKVALQAATGSEQWIFVYGEPGIGKSALVAEAARRLAAEDWVVLSSFCQAHRSADVFAAWQSPLRSLFGIAPDDSVDSAREKIERELARAATDHAPFAALILGLFGWEVEEGPLVRFLDARVRRQRLVAMLRTLLAARARERPLLLLFEDVHLSDEPSLELLDEVLAAVEAPVLFVATSRSGLPPEALRSREPDAVIELHELDREDARDLAASIGALDPQQVEALLDRAGGNPLFVQELALMGATGDAMPESVTDVIVARIDRLQPEEKTVLRAAAVAGSSFRDEYVRALVSGRLDERQLASTLDLLDGRGFTVRDAGDGTHAFRHPLAQEVIYGALPFGERRALHRTLAQHVERTEGSADAGLLLYHYDRAGEAAKTVVYAALSGDRAARSFANREAVDYYTRGLTALDALKNASESDRSILLERIGQCLETQGRHGAATEALVDALTHWRALGRPRRARLLSFDVPEKAREAALCRRIAVSYERSSLYDEALRWLDQALDALPARAGGVTAQVYGSRSVTLYRKGEHRDAIEWGRRSLNVARRIGDPAVIAYAENMLGNPYMAEGALREAARHWSEAVRLYDRLGDEPGRAASNNNLGSCYQLLGLLDAARKHYEIALEADERVGDRVDMAIVHNNIGEILLIQGTYDEAEAHLRRVLVAHGADEELTAVAGLSYVNLCRCSMARGNLGEAERYLRQGMRLLRAVGARGLLTEAQLQLAELRLAAGDLPAAQRESQRALAGAQSAAERLLEARGERILGLVRAAAGAVDAGAIHIATSVGLAKKIGASHEEARSLLALARLRIDTGGRPRSAGLRRAVAIFSRMGAAQELAEAEWLLMRLQGPAAR